MLLDPRQALEGGTDDAGGIMIAIPGQIGDFHPRVRYSLPDQSFNIVCRHRHEQMSYFVSITWRLASTDFSSSARRMACSLISTPAAVRSPSRFRTTSASPASSKSACTTASARSEERRVGKECD